MGRFITLLALLAVMCGCAGIPEFQGVQGIPIEGMTRVKVGDTSVLIAPYKRAGNGIVFVMEDGKIYWSKRYMDNDEELRLLVNDKNVEKWVHLSPVEEHQIKKGDVILACRSRQLYCLYF
jgi:hypothetical protein